jgi:catechol 2,3-dioxygenase-like lactoylglutathione lyase family enzyme
MTNAENFRPFAFVLAVPDLARSVAYFRDALGFTVGWEDVTGWRLLSRGQVNLMLGHCPDAMRPAQTGDHSYFAYLHVDDVDAVHAEFLRRGAIILSAPFDKPWGMREMAVATPDGHRMMIGHRLGLSGAP